MMMVMMVMMMILIETYSGHCMMEDDKATSSKAFSTGLDLFFYIALRYKTKESLVIDFGSTRCKSPKRPSGKGGISRACEEVDLARCSDREICRIQLQLVQ